MKKNILMIDTGRDASVRAAMSLKEHGCRVILVQKEKREVPGVEAAVVNLMDTGAVHALVEGLDHIDVLVLGAPPCPEDGPIGTGHDLNAMLEELVYFSRGTGNLMEACIPKLKEGMKRIACLTEPEGTHSQGRESGNILRHQMLAALGVLGKQLFNRYRPEGFTFRWFCEGNAPGPMSAGEYILSQLSYHPDEAYIHSEENRLVIRDGWLREIPW